MTSEKTPLAVSTKFATAALSSQWLLVHIEGPELPPTGTRYPLAGSVVFGRSIDADIAVPDKTMSRRHFAVHSEQEGCVVEDLGSTNGTFVDGERIDKRNARDGSIVRAGGSLFVIERRPIVGTTPSRTHHKLLGLASSWLRTLESLERAAPTMFPVLIAGETGTGKELLSSTVHELSQREGPYVTVNCGAIPQELAESSFFGHVKGAFTGALKDAAGHFENAHTGTLFLDEIGELPMSLQPKLLRALDSGEITPVGGTPKKVDVRVVSATNVDLRQAIEAGKFRADLYARLAGVVIQTPSLRDRRRDVLYLLRHFYEALCNKRLGLDVIAAEALVLHRWTFNLRELRAIAQRLTLLDKNVFELGDVLALLAEPTSEGPTERISLTAKPTTGDLQTMVRDPGRSDLEALLKKFHGNVAEIATALHKDRKQIYRWLKKHAIDPERFRNG